MQNDTSTKQTGLAHSALPKTKGLKGSSDLMSGHRQTNLPWHRASLLGSQYLCQETKKLLGTLSSTWQSFSYLKPVT